MNKGYYVFYDVDYISSNCDNVEWFETAKEVEDFVSSLSKCYVCRVQKC